MGRWHTLAWVCAMIACGEHHEAGAAHDVQSGREDVAGAAGRDAGMDSGAAQTAGGCVVALRVGRCCDKYMAVSRAEVQSDECLLPVPANPVRRAELVTRCAESFMEVCDAGPCPEELRTPPARLAVASGGKCRFADECHTDADCVVAKSASGCCNCAAAMPASLLETDTCLLPAGQMRDRPPRCASCDLTTFCPLCSPPDKARCVVGEPFNLCRSATE